MTAIEGLSAVYYDKAMLANLKAQTPWFEKPQTKSEKFLDDCREAIGEERKRPTPTAVSYKVTYTSSPLPPKPLPMRTGKTIQLYQYNTMTSAPTAPTARRRSKKTTAS